MPGRAPRRLPGVRFAAAPPPVDPLPRMDIALFAGFAAEGPIDVPVAVESVAEHAAIFGQDAIVAWDAARGEAVHAQLGPAVRAFFRNGGRRAWIVRVAGGRAAWDRFPLAGLLRATPEGDLVPAAARARCKGSWADALQASAALLASRIAETKIISFSPPLVDLHADAGSEVSPGDLLRITFRPQGLVWMVPVRALALADGLGGLRPVTPGQGRVFHVVAQGERSFWFRSGPPDPTLDGTFDVHAFDASADEAAPPPPPMKAHLDAGSFRDGEVSFVLEPPFLGSIAEGSFVRIDLGAEDLWVLVRARVVADSESGTITFSGPALRRMNAPPSQAELDALPREPAVERLRVELWARAGEAPPQRLSDLGLGRRHPRFWGALPTDEDVYRAHLPSDEALSRGSAGDERWSALWQSATAPRFPLAGDGQTADEDSVYLPVGMAFTADLFQGAITSGLAAPIRDGFVDRPGVPVALDRVLLDPALAETSVEALGIEADFLRYRSPNPRALSGIHAALGIDEVTIIAAPDAAHRRWSMPALTGSDEARIGEEAKVATQDDGVFRDCRLPLQAPGLDASVTADASGTFTLRWTGELDPGSQQVPGERYVLEESSSPDFEPVEVIYDRRETQLTIHGRPPGTWYYRVRIENVAGAGPWSAALAILVRPPVQALLEDVGAYASGGAQALLRVQAAMLRLGAARGDILALLDLPEHYREQEAIAHAAALASTLGSGSVAALGFGALYHPWVFTLEEAALGGSIRRTPPTGGIAGVMAQRALTRGAWIAAANVPLRAVVALTPSIGREAWQSLQDAQINLVRREPAGFLTLAEDTLSTDADLVPIHVRRLLSLLRRAALALGATYVFEPNGDAFRRMVQRGFEGLLGRMYARGAFAGANERAAFQVVAEGATSAREAEEGRFTVDLRVAPSAAMSFLTVRLVQSGDRSLVTEVR